MKDRHRSAPTPHEVIVGRIDAAVTALLDELGFSTRCTHPGCRDHAASSIRVHQMRDDECCMIYAFVPGMIGRLIEYEMRLPYAAPLTVIRAAIEAALKRGHAGAPTEGPALSLLKKIVEKAADPNSDGGIDWDDVQAARALFAR